MRRSRAGFTLAELLVVVVIITVLASIAIPKFQNASLRSTESSVRTQLQLLRQAVDAFNQDTGWYPATLEDLESTTCPANGLNGGGHSKAIDPTTWHGPYITNLGTDYPGWIAYNTTPPKMGLVYCPQPGNSTDGVPYSSW